jgi:hypothetical protein
MQKDSKILDDLARLGTSAMGGMMDIKREVEAMVAAKVEKLLARSQLVTREEYEVLRQTVVKLREDNEKLTERLDKLEKGVHPLDPR